MNTAADRTGGAAMDNEHPESPGEQTLNIRAVADGADGEVEENGSERDEPGDEAAVGEGASSGAPDAEEADAGDVDEGLGDSSGDAEPSDEPSGDSSEEFSDEPQVLDEAVPSAAEPDADADVVSAADVAHAADAVPAAAEAQLPDEAVQQLTAALGQLRESVSDLRFGLDLPGAEEARKARAELLAQLEDYVLPRVKVSTAPAMIVVAGSTGAGKSTLVNTLAEKNISRTGVRRPTTGTPVLACHPGDLPWFAEGDLLGGLKRLDKPSVEAGPDSIVLTATEKLPQGVALLDTPDIDSVVEEHHEIAHRMMDAADLWIFVTTATRYADAPAWQLLRLARERGVRLAIVLSRVQPRSRDTVLKHFVRMLTEYGLGDVERFVVEESKVSDGRLPDSEMTDLRLWLAELSVDGERRAQAVRQTLNGVLDSFRTRIPELARHMEGHVAFRGELRTDVEAAYMGAVTRIEESARNGSLLRGEVLARWQDFAGSGDLLRTVQLRGRPPKQLPERLMAFKAALRIGLESLIVSAASKASEEVAARWRRRSELGSTLVTGLERPSEDLVRRTNRAVSAWQEHVMELIRTEGVAKRSVSKVVSFDADALSLIFMVGLFGGQTDGVPQRLVKALLGAESLRGISLKSLSDLRARISMLFDEEAMRYVKVLDSAGIPDESAAARLYQATYNLEVAR
ncbi:GTPase [Nonomuraea soli]|uniref:Energy-coupling factor transporter ATP-binding protein EcfA2 n=1 Tax=Nonomuraea soli TaxID=1032476 RepID=A0A7W0CM06_9ACTN|nr:GTPase [Nonomuraea soli]MBA2893489.1 energy-coupling factor transporter ATP-binding protein EcfA2 [Nonomuraea soli]